jgi:hypothetical protein
MIVVRVRFRPRFVLVAFRLNYSFQKVERKTQNLTKMMLNNGSKVLLKSVQTSQNM